MFSNKAKLSLTATVVGAALVLTGCGSKDSETPASTTSAAATTSSSTQASSTSTSATSSSATSAPSSSAAESAPKTTEPAAPESPREEKPATPPAPAPAPAPAGNASPADAQAITDLAMSPNNAKTTHEYFGALINNMCSQANPQQAQEELRNSPNQPLDSIPEFKQQNPRVLGVDNIRVNGNTAVANVTATAGGETTTNEMSFLKENGKWTFCG